MSESVMVHFHNQPKPNQMKMIRLKACLCAGILTVGISALAATRSVPSQYSTIQAAVNASSSGDTMPVSRS